MRQTNGRISALLNNKETNDAVQVTLNLGSNVTGAQLIELTGPALDVTNGYTLGGAGINANGSWTGGVQSVITATNGQLTVTVPPISALLLNPEVAGTNINYSVTGNQLNLSWPSSYVGWLLQSNSVGLAASNAWYAVPGSSTTNNVQITIQPSPGQCVLSHGAAVVQNRFASSSQKRCVGLFRC